MCFKCAKRYCNEKSLITHMLECCGNIFNSTLTSISDKNTNDSSEVEICQAQTHSTLTGNSYKQLAPSVSGVNEENTVACKPREVAVVISESQSFEASTKPDNLGIIVE